MCGRKTAAFELEPLALLHVANVQGRGHIQSCPENTCYDEGHLRSTHLSRNRVPVLEPQAGDMQMALKDSGQQGQFFCPSAWIINSLTRTESDSFVSTVNPLYLILNIILKSAVVLFLKKWQSGLGI